MSITKALSHCQAVRNLSFDAVKAKQAAGFGGFEVASFGGMDSFTQGSRQKFAAFRGWVHSAIHALATEAASQPVMVGRLIKASKKPGKTKLIMPNTLRTKGAHKELEVIPDHELLPSLEHPNNMQDKLQFVYSFVANICLTGWGFVVVGEGEEGKPEFYSLPTTWVKPIHKKGAFAEFQIVNPNNPTAAADAKPLDRSQVAFAHFPNPSDPLAASSLTQAQAQGIKIDDQIQQSQAMFFENGVFPSAIVTVGGNPHPDFPAGVRPRLDANQRRQVYAAIKKLQSGVANYGNPVILDGLIEKVERLTATQNEMGWEKSEMSVRARILSAFGVHPFILGEQMAGSYAQAFIVRDIFCRRVNIFLDMLSTLMTGLCSKRLEDESLVVWWEEASAIDPSIENQKWNTARTRNDVTQNEFRQWMGLSPDEDGYEARIDRQLVAPVTTVATQVAAGTISPEQGQAILVGIGLPEDMAKEIAGKKLESAQPQLPPGMGGPPGQNPFGKPGKKPPPKPGQKPVADAGAAQGDKPVTDAEAVDTAAKALMKSIDYLNLTPDEIADKVLECV